MNDYKEIFNNNEESFDNVLEIIIGKRLNSIMTYLANKALLYKDGFDLVKNYYYDFESEYNKLYEEIKQLIISDIYKAKINDNIEDKKEDQKDTPPPESENKHESKKNKKKSKSERLEEKFGSKGAGNYKKKSNAKRILPKEKKKKSKKVEKDVKDNKEEEEKLKKQNEEKERFNNLNAKTLDQLIKEAREPLTEEISEKLIKLKDSIIDNFKKIIKEEIHSR